MQLPLACSKETLIWLFVYANSAFKLLFFFSFLLFPFSFKLFSSFLWRGREYEYDEDLPDVVVAAVEEEEEEEEGFGYYYSDFIPQSGVDGNSSSSDDYVQFEEPSLEDEVGVEEEEDGVVLEEVIVEDITGREDSYLDDDFETDQGLFKHSSPSNTQFFQGETKRSVEIEKKAEEEEKITREKELLIDTTTRTETTKAHFVDNMTPKDHQRSHGVVFDDEEEFYADSHTVGSTSKNSSEMRSSITFMDSCTDDPFSSSSRRSCRKWESYTVFQKYDEEMIFLDRISAQKLQETESLKSIQHKPRSISQRILHGFAATTTSKNTASDGQNRGKNPYHELEAVYVAQVCLAWEALSWDYINFRRKQTLLGKQETASDKGCSSHVFQEFQRFLVLLQRYIETEPYEHGKRPEIYARMRATVAPKLLLVPEYEDYEGDPKEHQEEGSVVPSGLFREIIEDSIRTFMKFLRADRESPYRAVLKVVLKRKKRGSIDPALVILLKKANKKKKQELEEMKRGGKKWMRKRKITKEEEMEILMGEIDLKVVSRVLTMWDINHEQLSWCKGKISKLTLNKLGKFHRDSTPLFFPQH